MGVSHLISIVGAGPGDPELLTIKAHKRLREADVILYDGLFGDEILKIAKPSAIKKYVGKWSSDGQDQLRRQNNIHNEFLYWAGKNKKVVRLKTGDPMVFGRGAEEIRFCKENNLYFEVIPGITAATAGASLFSVPLTERGKNNMVLFYASKTDENGFPESDSLINILNSGSPVVVYMGLKYLPGLASELEKKGLSGSTNIQILCKISQNNQSAYSTTISEVEHFLQNNSPETPSLIIIGTNAKRI